MSEENNNILCGATTAIEWNGNTVIIAANDPHILGQFLGSIGQSDVPPARFAAIKLGPHCEMQGIPAYVKLAQKLHGNPIGAEISEDEEADAKAAGLVVVFGYSDDCTEFRGVIHDEVGMGKISLTAKGKILDEEQLEGLQRLQDDGLAREVNLRTITAKFTDEGHRYETDIPHAPFDVMEDGEVFCRGIVFSINDL